MLMINFSKLRKSEYEQLRTAALTSVNSALSRYDAHRYQWFDKDEKNDIISDAFTKAIATFNVNGGCSFKTWLKRIAYQVTIDRLNVFVETEGTTYETPEGDEIEIAELTNWTTAEDVVIGWETRQRIDDLLANRGETDSLIFSLFEQGYKSGEIAKKLGLTDQAVYSRLHKAKQAVSMMLAA